MDDTSIKVLAALVTGGFAAIIVLVGYAINVGVCALLQYGLWHMGIKAPASWNTYAAGLVLTLAFIIIRSAFAPTKEASK